MTDEERAARVSAALAYRFPFRGPNSRSAIDQARELGFHTTGHPTTPSRNKRWTQLLAGDATQYDQARDKLVEVTKVPRWFFERGFAPPPGRRAAPDLTKLEAKLDALLDLFSSPAPQDAIDRLRRLLEDRGPATEPSPEASPGSEPGPGQPPPAEEDGSS